MSSNINKSEKMVSVVADTIAIDYAEELRSSGMSKEQVRKEVMKFLTSPDFIEAVQRRVDEIIAKFDGYKSGHALNNQLLRNVKSDPTSYEIVTFNDETQCPIPYVSVT